MAQMFFRIVEIAFASYMVPALLLPAAWLAGLLLKGRIGVTRLPAAEIEGQWRLLFGLFVLWFALFLAVAAGAPLNRGGATAIVVCWIVYAARNCSWRGSCCGSRRLTALIPAGQVADRAFMRFLGISSPPLNERRRRIRRAEPGHGRRLESASSGSAGDSGGNLNGHHFLHVLQCVPHVHVGVVHLSVGGAHGAVSGCSEESKYQIWPKDAGDEDQPDVASLGAISLGTSCTTTTPSYRWTATLCCCSAPFGLGSAHCVAMCGPTVAMCTAQFVPKGATSAARCGLRILFNLGRIATYSLIGLVVGAFGQIAQAAASRFGVTGVVAIAAGGASLVFGLSMVGWFRDPARVVAMAGLVVGSSQAAGVSSLGRLPRLSRFSWELCKDGCLAPWYTRRRAGRRLPARPPWARLPCWCLDWERCPRFLR